MSESQEELASLYVKVKADVTELERELKQLKLELNRDSQRIGTDFGENLGKTSGSSFARVFGGYLLQFASVVGLGKFISNTVRAFSEQEDAEKKLYTQLGYTNKALLGQASALQKVTKYGDEQVIKTQALIAAFTKDEGQISQLTEATLDFAEGLGMDLNSAAQLVAKTFGSSVNSLVRYGLHIDGAAGSSERLKQLTDEITRLFGGQAKSAANTFSGRVQKLKNNFGELQEQIGKFLIPALDSLVTKLGGVVTAMDKIGNSKVIKILWEGMPFNTKDQITNEDFVKKWNDTVKNAKIKINTGDSKDLYLLKEQTDELKKQRGELEELLKAKLKEKDFKPPVDNTDRGGSFKDDFKFNSSIPEGYTAAQVAEYESLKFAAKGYVDFAIAEIQRKYKVEVTEAQGNVERIKQAEENKKLALAKLNQEMIEIEKEGSVTTEQIIQDSLERRSQDLEDQITRDAQAEADAYSNKQVAIDNYYQDRQAKDEEYVKWKLEKIAEETNAFLLATGNEILAVQLRNEQLKALEQEYFDWKLEEWKKQNKVADAAFNALESGMTDALQLIKIRTKENVSVVEQVFVDMANTFIAQVERMIAEWLSFQLLKGIAGIIAAPFTGGASAVAAIPAHTGGEFLGTKTGIKKLASGGNFIVPSGYPNDSYPLLVESGERVSVTPADRVSNDFKLLEAVNKKLDILNENLINKNLSVQVINKTELDGRELAKAVNTNIKRMEREGRRF